MYQVSNDYKIKMLDQVQTHRLKGTINGISFTDADVIGVSYTNQCSAKNVNIGSVNIGTLKLTFLKDILNRGSYMGQTITISDGLLIGYDEDDEPVWEDIPVGTFYIADATWTSADIISVTAYDCLSKMDEPLQLDQSSGTIYAWLSYIATQTGTEFGMTQEECAVLPNGLEYLSPNEENSLETWRDLLSALAQMVGGFVYAGKDGKFYIKAFDDIPVQTIPKNRRVSGAKFSDYTTLYDAISFVDADKIDRVVGDASGLVMKLGNNPFLQTGSYDAVNRRALNIVSSIENMTYTPFDVSMLPAFIALDLGDVISFTDDYAEETTTGAVMSLTWTYNKAVKVSCYGDNPNLRSSQSKTDKNISGLARQTAENEVTYYTYANIEPITFGSEEEVSIARLRFTSAQKTTVKILHEFIFDMLADLSTAGSYEIHYYLDNELVAYSPYERIGGIYGGQSGTTEFSICRDLFYVLKDVEPNNAHIWEVKIVAHGIDSVTIDTNHAHVTLEGQRLYGEEYFSGLIEASDVITIIPLGYLSLVSITDSAFVDTPTASGDSVSDNINLIDIATLEVITISEGSGSSAPQIRLRGGAFINTEDHKRLCTEDGIRFVTSR